MAHHGPTETIYRWPKCSNRVWRTKLLFTNVVFHTNIFRIFKVAIKLPSCQNLHLNDLSFYIFEDNKLIDRTDINNNMTRHSMMIFTIIRQPDYKLLWQVFEKFSIRSSYSNSFAIELPFIFLFFCTLFYRGNKIWTKSFLYKEISNFLNFYSYYSVKIFFE